LSYALSQELRPVKVSMIGVCVCDQSRMATDTEILRCHSSKLLELIKRSVKMTEDQLYELSVSYDGVYIHPVRDIAFNSFTL